MHPCLTLSRANALPRGVSGVQDISLRTPPYRRGAKQEINDKYPDAMRFTHDIALAGRGEAPSRWELRSRTVRRNLCRQMAFRAQDLQAQCGIAVGGISYTNENGEDLRIIPKARRFARIDGSFRNTNDVQLKRYFPALSAAVGICHKYNAGLCQSPDFLPYVCPHQCGRLHVCCFCLGGHPIDDCASLDFLFDQTFRIQEVDLRERLAASQEVETSGDLHNENLLSYGVNALQLDDS